LARDHGAGDFASGENRSGFEFHFGAALRKFSERDEGIGSVETHANDIDVFGSTHWKRLIVSALIESALIESE
jgi:hypothetical protein